MNFARWNKGKQNFMVDSFILFRGENQIIYLAFGMEK